MFRLTTLTFFLLAAGSTFAKNHHPSVEQGAGAIHLIAEFRQWVTEHGKKYSSEAEEMLRLKVWAANHGTFACLRRCCGQCVRSGLYTLVYSKTGILACDTAPSLIPRVSLFFFQLQNALKPIMPNLPLPLPWDTMNTRT